MTIRLDPIDMAACRALLKGGSRTFNAASKVLPRRVAEPAIALYAFCRLADDAVDLGEDRAAAVTRLRDRLDRAYRRQPTDLAADRLFADVVSKFCIPRELPEALLEGLAWDAEVRRYETLQDLTAYAARVAGAVGAMMTLVMGQRAPEIVARACDLGVAMQLTNIARDVGEDARAGRLYLPQSWLREAGVDPDIWLANPCFTPEVAAIVQRLLDAADTFYSRATHGIANLPIGCRPGIYAARALYAEIGRELERSGLDSVSQRAVVSTNRKLAVLARTLLLPQTEWAPARKLDVKTADIEETRFLVEAVAATPLRDNAQPRRRPIEDRVVWVIDLFERLERRDQLQRTASYR
ncbi:phytoene/squalene synthase family protein [Bradyrhizobium manausense]|uniref:phytoene/squalene synthase family protein n=1 Tax=Bradyrhizobium manausense TaxID=989370 RepID=UPI001BA56C3F|nr:phytoene/squalene synthase family protein [Bradyrhizobium manausense]MBR1088429.1 phytoene/squalene synthase family protein [Bradyrhizobium manausense]